MRTLGQSLRSYPARGQRPLQNFKNSTSIPGKQALPVGRSSEFYRSGGLDLWQEIKS